MKNGKVLWMAILALLVYGTLLFSVLFCSSCRATRISKDERTATSTKSLDSVRVQSSAIKNNTDSTSHVLHEADTAIGVASATVSLAMDSDRDTTAKEGNVTLRTYTDKHGIRHIDCKSDSLTLVIRKLVYERDFFRHSADALLAQNTTDAHYEESDSTHIQTETITPPKSLRERLRSALALLGLCVAGIIAGYLIRMFQK